MKTQWKQVALKGLCTGVATVVFTTMLVGSSIAFGSSAYADEHGGSGGSGGSGGYSGGSGKHGSGASGQKGPSADSDAKGPRFKGGTFGHKPSTGSRGGKPAWAQEGIPETELGRLNVSRAPAHVIDKAGEEAVSNFDPDVSAVTYSLTAEAFAAQLESDYNAVVRIDSPLENLSLYQDISEDGITSLPGVTPASVLDMAAIFLGSAADKTIPITVDTVNAVNTILSLPTLTPQQAETLATKADAVRSAILTGHEG